MVTNTFYVINGKRLLDIALSLLVCLVMWPVFLVIAILVKLSSPGAIFFRQKRTGKNGSVFTLYKFRTMTKNALKLQKKYLHLNEADGPVFKIRNDPRFVNGLGKFLARSGLDELPNIFNVLKGDLSWVGPRPLPVNEAKKIPTKIKRIRESVLPGITSSWVIKGNHELSFSRWMAFDQQDSQNQSLTYDLKILGKTLFLCLKNTINFLLKKARK